MQILVWSVCDFPHGLQRIEMLPVCRPHFAEQGLHFNQGLSNSDKDQNDVEGFTKIQNADLQLLKFWFSRSRVGPENLYSDKWPWSHLYRMTGLSLVSKQTASLILKCVSLYTCDWLEPGLRPRPLSDQITSEGAEWDPSICGSENSPADPNVQPRVRTPAPDSLCSRKAGLPGPGHWFLHLVGERNGCKWWK